MGIWLTEINGIDHAYFLLRKENFPKNFENLKEDT
jgi:hypothetical protein